MYALSLMTLAAPSDPLGQKNHVLKGGPLSASHGAVMFKDTTAQMGVHQIQSLPESHWQPFSGTLSEGFTSSVLWLRFGTIGPATSDQPWVLTLDQPLLGDVRLYTKDKGGQLTERYGTTLSAEQPREMHDRFPTFELKNNQTGGQMYWLQIRTPTAMLTSVYLYPMDEFISSLPRHDFLWGMMFGTYLFVVVFYLLFWFWTRERLHVFYTGYILINFLAAFYTSGWPLQYLPEMPSSSYIKQLGIWVALSVTAGTWMSTEFLKMHERMPQLCAWLRGLAIVISGVGVVASLGNRYTEFIPLIQMASMGLIMLFMILAVRGALHGDRPSQVFLIAFSWFYAGVIWRYLRNLGWVESNFWSDNSYQLGAFVHMLVMSLIIFASYNRLLKDKKETQLQLEYELRMRAEQRKFADIVSHEFRTPLSVVHASLGNLQVEHKDQPETLKRLQRIERATERMHTLINDYLQTERLMLDAHQPLFRRHDVVKICRIAAEDLSESDRDRIEIRAAKSIDALCDMDLIRIAVHNLLSNACKHSQTTQTITLSIYSQDNSVLIEVTDRGVGIAKDELEKIFDRHYRGKQLSPTEGRGLGLYIVQLIAASHHGKVTVRSRQNAETVFTLELPA